jgi:hypothetical protein
MDKIEVDRYINDKVEVRRILWKKLEDEELVNQSDSHFHSTHQFIVPPRCF